MATGSSKVSRNVLTSETFATVIWTVDREELTHGPVIVYHIIVVGVIIVVAVLTAEWAFGTMLSLMVLYILSL